MVYSYKRKTDRGAWSEGDMERAIQAVRNGEMGWLKASKIFNVPTATLRRRAQGKNKFAVNAEKRFGSFQFTLTKDLEGAIVKHILDLESRFFGMTRTDVRRLAYEVAEKMKIKHPFNKELKMAGKGWLHGFRQRNPELSLRLPEATSLARAEAFNKPQVDKFFSKLEQVIKTHKIDKTMIYNMDESALTTVQVPPKVFAQKGKKQVGAITSAERGVHTTVVACVSSGGVYVPPAIIFPRKRFNPDLYDGAPIGTLKLHNDSGYMTSDLFVKWIEHFIEHVRPSEDKKALLILDGHSSHKSYGALELAKVNSIILLCLPAHCTHHLQPLDVAFFGPLQKYYNQTVTQWLRDNPGRTVSIYQVSKLFNKAYEKTATFEIARSAFRATGISPFNPGIFPDHLFLPSLTTDVEEPVIQEKNPMEDGFGTKDSPITVEVTEQVIPNEAIDESGSSSLSKEPVIQEINSLLQELSPIPQSTTRRTVKRKNTGYQDVLTESPYLQSLREKEVEKDREEGRKKNRNVVKRKLVGIDCKNKNQKDKKSSRLIGRSVKRDKSETEEEEDPFCVSDTEDDCACLYCNDLFSRSRSKEKWFQCQLCQKWTHADCAGLSARAKMYICELCKD